MRAQGSPRPPKQHVSTLFSQKMHELSARARARVRRFSTIVRETSPASGGTPIAQPAEVEPPTTWGGRHRASSA